MKLRLGLVDDDDDDAPWVAEDDRLVVDPFDARFGPRGKPRLRAPSDDETSDSSSDFDDADEVGSPRAALFHRAEAVPTLSAVSRQDLLRRVEKSCEKRALDAVTSSMAYMALCSTLKSAHADAERQLDGQPTRDDDASLASLFHRHVEQDTRAKKQLDQLHQSERKAFESAEKMLAKYQKEQEELSRAEREEIEREDEARRKAEEARREQQRRKEEAANAATAARLAQEERERKEKEAADQEAVQREERKKQDEEKQKKQAEARSAAQKIASEYIVAGRERIARLEAIQAISEEISGMTDPAVKRLRVDIKKQAGACNQISAAPSSIKSVVDKIQSLLTTARNFDEKVFKFALNLVAGNLAQQARVILDYKACYPLAHVIMMSCVRTPELTDVMLGYFNQMCLYTIPQFLKKTQSQSMREYQLSVGFEVAVGKEDDNTKGEPELEHITEYSKRMSMISAVLAATMQTMPWDGSPQPVGLRIGDCWTWLARLANDEPDLLTGSLLLTILEVAGYELSKTYKKQFHKLLVLIARQIGPRLSKNTRTGAANAAGQLEMFITEYEQRGCQIVEPPARKLEESKISEADEDKTDGDKGGYGGGGGGYGGGGRGYGGGRGGGRGGRGRY